ncbi:MAG: hypothetical protein ABIQ89_03840 [Candidatus Saccharimonadales bacterium]
MAKKAPKNRLLAKFSTARKNPKLIVGGLIAVLLIVVLVVFLVSRNKTPTKTSSASELAKSSVNTKNTKDVAGSSPTGSSSDNPTSSGPTASSPTASKKTSPTTAGSGATSSAPSSGGGSTSAPTPTVVPFEFDGPPYINVDDRSVDVGCNQSHQFNFTASISATAAGTATYHWEFSDGGSTAPQSLVFGGAGTQQVNTSWTLASDSTPGMYQVTGWASAVFTSPSETATKPNDGTFTMYVSC